MLRNCPSRRLAFALFGERPLISRSRDHRRASQVSLLRAESTEASDQIDSEANRPPF